MNEDKVHIERLDQRVVSLLPGLSRSHAAHLIEAGKVSVNGVAILKASAKTKADDIIKIAYEAEQQPVPDIDLPIIYEDNDCIVINKPVGVLTHSKGAFNPEATVATFIRKKVQGMTGERAGIVHRLDRATSGVIICAKNMSALSWLQKQFSLRKVKKTYIAIASGGFSENHAIIDMPIARNPKRPQIFRVDINGKSALTEYHVISSNSSLAKVELKPTTGRTHQLRVHLSQLGHPILGDGLYGGRPAERLFLHAQKLEITLLNRERRIFEAPLPKVFDTVIKK